MMFSINNSPFFGKDGKFVTSRHLRDRLMKETEKNLALRVEDTDSADSFLVYGRGILHLGVLVETMRREGYELQVSKPEVIVRLIDGVRCEPVERVQIDVPEEHTGSIMESMGARKGELLDMINSGSGQVRLLFTIPARGLIGYSTEFLTITRGYGIMNHSFDSYQPMAQGQVGGRRQGVLVSMESGKTTQYGIMQVEDRGVIFVEPGTDIYEGMIVGEHNRDSDLTVNIVKAKQMTNMRSANKDQTSSMKKPRIMSLEEALEYLNDDEYCEVTPDSIRLRKKILDKNERERAAKRKKVAVEEK
jgi:GTP-binding protein